MEPAHRNGNIPEATSSMPGSSTEKVLMKRLKLMKPDAVIVNTSRGEVIDENALTRMLRSHEIAGAGLDVFEHG